jgi:hypothetical protein
VEGSATGFPLNLTDDPLTCPGCGIILTEWRDEFSLQDLNGDGTITLAESQETLFHRGLYSRVRCAVLPTDMPSFGAEETSFPAVIP